MDAERARVLLLGLPHVAETMQWGANLVFWVGDKAIGGKMFALMNLEEPMELVISFAAGPEHAADLCEREGFRPAPYFARHHWVAAEHWKALSAREWEADLRAAHAIVHSKLPPRTRAVLGMSAKDRAKLVTERRRQLQDAAKSRAIANPVGSRRKTKA